MNEETQKLLKLLSSVPINTDALEQYLKDNNPPSEVLAEAAKAFIEMCASEDEILKTELGRFPFFAERYSNKLTDVFELFLTSGMDPNSITDGEPLMLTLLNVSYHRYGCEALKAMLESGGNPNLHFNDTTLFDKVTYEVSFGGMGAKKFEFVFSFWLLLFGFGGTVSEGTCPVEMAEGISADVFRDYSLYDFYIGEPGNKRMLWLMSLPGHIINKYTHEEVATFEL